MDIRTAEGEQYGSGIPEDPAAWESYIFHQQKIFTASPKSVSKKRRRTVHGIPSLASFIRGHEDREHERERRAHDQHQRQRPRQDSHQHSTDDKDAGAFPMDGSFAGSPEKAPFLNHSYSSSTTSSTKRVSPRTTRHNHHRSASRHSCHKASSARKSTPDSPGPENASISFEERVDRDKARFYAEQGQRRYYPQRSHLNATMFAHTDYRPPSPVQAPRPPVQESLAAYIVWHKDCDIQLRDKTTMTHIPVPPIPACIECINSAMLSGHQAPIACTHSLDKLFRTSISSTSRSKSFSKIYLEILKSERQRWHTDRFGACPPAAKPRIMRDAQQLFITINTLFETERLRVEATPPVDDVFESRTSNTTTTPAPRQSREKQWYDFDDVRAW